MDAVAKRKIVVVINSVQKLLDTPLYTSTCVISAYSVQEKKMQIFRPILLSLPCWGIKKYTLLIIY
jgi:hypothetical protein